MNFAHSSHDDEPCWILSGVRCEKRNAGNSGRMCKNCKKKFHQVQGGEEATSCSR